MVKNDRQESFEKILSASLIRSIDFVKFAETKNAALLTFSSAWIIAICNIMLGGKTFPYFYTNLFEVALILFIVSTLVAILSFLPKTKLSSFTKNDNRTSNLLFFKDIASLRIPDFENQIQSRYMPSAQESFTSEYFSDIINQISVNSQIATNKFKQFHCGALFSLTAIIILLISPSLHLIMYLRSLIFCQ